MRALSEHGYNSSLSGVTSVPQIIMLLTKSPDAPKVGLHKYSFPNHACSFPSLPKPKLPNSNPRALNPKP